MPVQPLFSIFIKLKLTFEKYFITSRNKISCFVYLTLKILQEYMTPNKYQIHLDPKLRCAFVRHDGQISLSDVPNSLMEILRHPDYSEGMNILRDARAARLPKEYGYHFFVKESPKRLGQIEEELGKCSLAWVLGGPTDFAVTHQFILSRRLSNDKIERRPFRSLDAAMEWLEIPPRFRIPIFNG